MFYMKAVSYTHLVVGKSMELIQEINEYLQLGKAKMVKALIRQALAEDIDPKVILDEGLLAEIGRAHV